MRPTPTIPNVCISAARRAPMLAAPATGTPIDNAQRISLCHVERALSNTPSTRPIVRAPATTALRISPHFAGGRSSIPASVHPDSEGRDGPMNTTRVIRPALPGHGPALRGDRQPDAEDFPRQARWTAQRVLGYR